MVSLPHFHVGNDELILFLEKGHFKVKVKSKQNTLAISSPAANAARAMVKKRKHPFVAATSSSVEPAACLVTAMLSLNVASWQAPLLYLHRLSFDASPYVKAAYYI